MFKLDLIIIYVFWTQFHMQTLFSRKDQNFHSSLPF